MRTGCRTHVATFARFILLATVSQGLGVWPDVCLSMGMSMSKLTSFRELQVWQKAMDVAEGSLELAKRSPAYERFVLGTAICKSGVSVPSNIAEGFGRHSTAAYINHLWDCERFEQRIANAAVVIQQGGGWCSTRCREADYRCRGDRENDAGTCRVSRTQPTSMRERWASGVSGSPSPSPFPLPLPLPLGGYSAPSRRSFSTSVVRLIRRSSAARFRLPPVRLSAR